MIKERKKERKKEKERDTTRKRTRGIFGADATAAENTGVMQWLENEGRRAPLPFTRHEKKHRGAEQMKREPKPETETKGALKRGKVNGKKCCRLGKMRATAAAAAGDGGSLGKEHASTPGAPFPSRPTPSTACGAAPAPVDEESWKKKRKKEKNRGNPKGRAS